LELTGILLSAGANKLALDNYKYTPLHFAAYWGHLEVVKILVEAGGNTTAVNSIGVTPIQAAKGCRHKDIANYLETV